MVDQQTRGLEDQLVEQAFPRTSTLSYLQLLIVTTTIITFKPRQMTD